MILIKILTFLKNTKVLAPKVLARVLLPSPSELISLKNVDKILIYGVMGIGNMIMFTPTLRAIRRNFSNARIMLLVAQSGCEDVVCGSPLVDEIIKAETGFWKNLKLAKQMRGKHFDLLVSTFHGNKDYLVKLTMLSGIPYRAGHCTSPDWYSEHDYLYNIPVRMLENEHEVDRGLHLAEALGCTASDKQLFFHIDEEAHTFARHFFENEGLSDKDWVLGVQVGTWKVQNWKQWDAQKLAKVCDHLITERRVKIIVLGSSDNQDTLDLLLGAMKQHPIIAFGKTTIKQTAAIIKRCNATLCNDSGLMHISTAVGTPVVAIIGPTDYRRTGPYGDGHIIVRKDLPCSPCFTMSEMDMGKTVKDCIHRKCITSITVRDVLSAVGQMKEHSTSIKSVKVL